MGSPKGSDGVGEASLPKIDIRPNIDGIIPVIPELAAEIGLEESLMLMQVKYWIKISDNLRDGEWWTYQSVRDIRQKAFPFMSISSINRVINRMEARKLIKTTDKYNEKKYDKTRWIALDPVGLSKLRSITITTLDGKIYPVPNCNDLSQIDTRSTQDDTRSAQNGTRSAQNETTIPETPTENTTETSTEKKEKDSSPTGEQAAIAFCGLMAAFVDSESKKKPFDAFVEKELDLEEEKPALTDLQLAVIHTMNCKRPEQGAPPGVWSYLNLWGNFFTGSMKPKPNVKKQSEYFNYQFSEAPMTPIQVIAFRLWYQSDYPDLDFPQKPETLERYAGLFWLSPKRERAEQVAAETLKKLKRQPVQKNHTPTDEELEAMPPEERPPADETDAAFWAEIDAAWGRQPR